MSGCSLVGFKMNLLRNWTRREGFCSAHKVAIVWPQNVVNALWLSACPRCQLLVITKVVLEDEQSNSQHRLYVQQCLRALLSSIFIATHSGQFWLKIMLANRGMGWMRALAIPNDHLILLERAFASTAYCIVHIMPTHKF
jgi:hypothetical protein